MEPHSLSEALKLSRKDIDLNENVMIVRERSCAAKRIPIVATSIGCWPPICDPLRESKTLLKRFP